MSARMLALVLAAAPLFFDAGCSRPRTEYLPPEQAQKLLLDRNWIDRLPQKIDDKIHVFRFVPSMGGGVYQDRTIFFGTFELFQFRQDGRTIDFALLHTGDRKTAKFTIEPIQPKKRGDVDLKLTIEQSPRGPSVYYGWRNEGKDLDAHLAAIGKALHD